MARAVRVSEFQRMQRTASNGHDAAPGEPFITTREDPDVIDPFTIDPAAEDAEATARLKAIGYGAEPNVAGQEGPLMGDMASSDQPRTRDSATLSDLDVGAQCTAEMSLHMITERVRDAIQAAGQLLPSSPTDAEIVAEAERIWMSLDRKRSHTYSVEADGTVRDWRRPDTTPDRGDVTAVHTISDETRFSGAGAADDVPLDEPSKLVPADKDFNDKPYLESTGLAMLASDLIEKHGYLDHLEHCEIRYWWQRKSGSAGRQRVLGSIKRGSGHYGQLLGADFSIILAADTARERHHTDRRVERSLFRQLRRLGQDDKGNFILLPWSLQLFPEEIQEYADLDDDDLKLGRNAYRGAEQMGLFRDDAAPVDDGSGVLIWPDGTALTDDEIEAMERHELADDDLAEGFDLEDEAIAEAQGRPFDEPADPDGPAPDDYGLEDMPTDQEIDAARAANDPLADHDL